MSNGIIEPINPAKEVIKEKIFPTKDPIYLSAQEYGLMKSNEKKLMREVLQGEKIDPDEYEVRMKKLWPKTFVPKPLVWRRK